MRKILIGVLLTTGLLAFKADENGVKNKLIGTWKWDSVYNPEKDQSLSVEQLMMGMASEVTTTLNEDMTYTETKVSTKDDKPSSREGTWRLEEGGTVLSLNSGGDKWKPAKIKSLTDEELQFEMRPNMIMKWVKKAE